MRTFVRRLRDACVAVPAVTTVVVTSAAGAWSAAPAHTPTAPTTPTTNTPVLTATQAQAQARATGKAVPVDGATTATDTLVANPNGTFTRTRSAVAVRKRVGSSLAGIGGTMPRTAAGTHPTHVKTVGLSVSGGGGGRLGTMTGGGRSLALSLRMTLPAPTLPGPTATYPSVLPAVDLQVNADVQGGFSEVLVIHTAAAAANPALTTLTLAAKADGVTLSADATGNITANDRFGRAVFTAMAPTMWDSAKAAPSVTATDVDGTVLDAHTSRPVASGPVGPGEAAHVAGVPATAPPTAGTLKPDHALPTAAP